MAIPTPLPPEARSCVAPSTRRRRRAAGRKDRSRCGSLSDGRLRRRDDPAGLAHLERASRNGLGPLRPVLPHALDAQRYGGMDAAASTTRCSARSSSRASPTLISVPIGILTAVYLVEYGSGHLARGRDLPGGRHDGHPVDRRRSVRLLALLPDRRAGQPQRCRRRGRAVGADDPGGRALDRGDAAARPERAARGVARPRRAEVAHDHPGRAAHGGRRHHHRRHARDRPRHRRDRAAAHHRRRDRLDQRQRVRRAT